jgi:hypothetical protein
MANTTRNSVISVIIFIILYSFFVLKVQITFDGYSDIIVGTTFFFTLFIGYFITRQNDRYSDISDQLTSNDGYFSYLYRITGLVPRIQSEVRDIIRDHYTKIVESKNLAYHVTHPSNTLTRMTKSLASITDDENNNPAVGSAWGFLFEVISDLQLTRKKILNLYSEKLVPFQWAVVYILAVLLVVSFNFVPSTSHLIDFLKVCFGTAVFISVILLHQLDNLTLFGDTAGMNSVEDILSIIDEKDAEELAKASGSK